MNAGVGMRAIANKLNQNLVYNERDFSFDPKYNMDKKVYLRFFNKSTREYIRYELTQINEFNYIEVGVKKTPPSDVFLLDELAIHEQCRLFEHYFWFLSAFIFAKSHLYHFSDDTQLTLDKSYKSINPQNFVHSPDFKTPIFFIHCYVKLRLDNEFKHVLVEYQFKAIVNSELFRGTAEEITNILLKKYVCEPLERSLDEITLNDSKLLEMIRL